MWNETAGEEYERGNNSNASDPAAGEFVDAEMPVLRFNLMFVPARVSLADLGRLCGSLSTRLGIHSKGKY